MGRDVLSTIIDISALVLIAMAVGLTGYNLGVERVRSEAVKTSCAQHSPVTGEFEWLEGL